MRLNPLQIARSLALGAVLLALGFYLGRQWTLTRAGTDPEASHSLSSRLAANRGELSEARAELEILRTRHEVDRQALELVRREMARQQDHAGELQEELRFYRSLMAPGETAGGLSVRDPELIATRVPGQYALRLVIQQEARKHELVQGSLGVAIRGVLDGRQVSLPLQSLSSGPGADDALALRFRYFQAVEQEFALPQGLRPEAIAVEVRASEPREMEVAREFPWRVQERFSHVGQ